MHHAKLNCKVKRVCFVTMVALSAWIQASGTKQPVKVNRYHALGQYEVLATSPMWQASLIYGNQYWSYAKVALCNRFGNMTARLGTYPLSI